MDLKGQIVDTKIKIIPSKDLLKFLSDITTKDSVPSNLAKFIKSDIQKQGKISQKKIDFQLSNDELKIIEELQSKIESDQKSEIGHQDKEGTKNKKEENTSSDDAEILYLEDINWLYLYLQNLRKESSKELPYLHELLEGSEILTPENEVLKRNPELEARCVKLRAQQEAREYRAMTKGVDNVRMKFPEDSISYQLKQLNRQLIAVGQFLISIFAGFLFGFKGVDLMIGGLDFGFRLLLGVMCALVIALAEIYFLAKQLNEELSIPETTQIGGPAKFTNNSESSGNTETKGGVKKEHQE